MTYPPARHLLRDLGFSGTRADDRSVNELVVTPGLRDDRGVRLGVLATMVDVGGAGIAEMKGIAVEGDTGAVTADGTAEPLRRRTEVIVDAAPRR